MLPVETVQRLHYLLAGDPVLEGFILAYISERYGARNLFHLPPHVAAAIIDRPGDFIRAVKKHYEPDIPF